MSGVRVFIPTGAEEYGKAVMETQQLLGQTSLHPSWGQVSTHALFTSGTEVSPAFLSVALVLQPANGAHPLSTGPQDNDAKSVPQHSHSLGWMSTCALSLFL